MSTSVSLILSTYNAPDLLEKAIWGYQRQTFTDFELIVADDGSSPETALLCRRLQRHTQQVIRHVWHEDRGFRKCVILNRAILTARGAYLVFSDGDCIPREDFLQVHWSYAQPGRFLSGGCLRLPRQLSSQIEHADIWSGRAFDAAWLVKQGLAPSLKCTKLVAGRFAPLFNHLWPTKATWNGHNASGWKADLLRVNGFDERMQYGGEDRELGERLMNAGLRPKQIRFSAVCLHLWHERGYVTEEGWRLNRAIRNQTRDEKVIRTRYGIDGHESEPGQGLRAA
jgi:glycosyltransferase involved in cell wall biosynthesis